MTDESKKPLVMLTGGHSSRFNIDLMRFCRDKRREDIAAQLGTVYTLSRLILKCPL